MPKAQAPKLPEIWSVMGADMPLVCILTGMRTRPSEARAQRSMHLEADPLQARGPPQALAL